MTFWVNAARSDLFVLHPLFMVTGIEEEKNVGSQSVPMFVRGPPHVLERNHIPVDVGAKSR